VEHDPGPVGQRRLRWGLPDVAFAWLAGGLASFLAAPFYDPDLASADQPVRFVLAAVILQNLGIVLALIVVSARKGRHSLGRDVGIVWPLDRLRPVVALGWLAAGAGLSIVAALALLPIAELAGLDDTAQQVSDTVERAGGAGLVLLLVSVVFVAPVVEELLFRGALQRALLRRFTAPLAVFVAATVFAAVHVVGDPGSYPVVPGLMLLGLVSGYEAVRTGDLSRSILLHMGFNLISAVLITVN
jgi:membrane protease YdiL (CAAX protease family)